MSIIRHEKFHNIMMSNKTKTGLYLMACFVLPCVILLGVFISYGFAPFGDKSLMIMDMSGQYSEFFCGLKNINSQNGGVLFSWSKALGGNYAGVFSYYVSSPLSFITLFFPNEYMHIGVMVLTFLKIGLCGLTFGILMNHFNKNKARNIIFAIFYGLMSYNIAYSMSLMWLDAVIWLPIIILAIEKIACGGKPYLLCISYTMLFVSTYYISYMVGIFSCIYVLYVFVRGGKAFLRNGLSFCAKFVGSVIVAAGMCAWLLLPTFFSLFEGKIGNAQAVPENGINYSLPQILNNFFSGAFDGITNNGTPFFYCGIIVFALYFGYFFIKSIPVREKVMTAGITLFIAVSTYFFKLDIAWHVFQRPNWFPYRYFFLFGFVMVFTAAKAAARFKEIPYVSHIAFALLTMGFFGYIKSANSINVPMPQFNFTVIILIITVGLLFAGVVLQRVSAEKEDLFSIRMAGSLLIVLFLAVTAMDTFYNSRCIIAGLDRDHRYEDYAQHRDYKKLTQSLACAAENDSNGDFYRIGSGFQRTFNEAVALGYGGINHYSSSFNSDLNGFLKEMGFAQNWYWSSYSGSTAVTDALLSVKYVMSDSEILRLDDNGKIISWCNVPYENYDVVTAVDSAVLYKNPYYLTPCIAVSDDLKLFDWKSNAIESQNFLLNCMLENNISYFLHLSEPYGGVFKERGDGYIAYYITVPKTGPLYACFPSNNRSTKMSINGDYEITLFKGETDCTQYIGYYEAGETVCVNIESDRLNTFGTAFYLLDEVAFAEAITVMNENSLKIKSWSSGYIEGSLTSRQDGAVFTGLVYDEAWSVHVDGKKVETYALKDGLLCFDIAEGEHFVEIKYNVPGFTAGIAISCITFTTLLISCAVNFARRKNFVLFPPKGTKFDV